MWPYWIQMRRDQLDREWAAFQPYVDGLRRRLPLGSRPRTELEREVDQARASYVEATLDLLERLDHGRSNHGTATE